MYCVLISKVVSVKMQNIAIKKKHLTRREAMKKRGTLKKMALLDVVSTAVYYGVIGILLSLQIPNPVA